MTIEKVTFDRAIKMLDALGAKYHIQYNDQIMGQPLTVKRDRKYEHGSISSHVKPYLENLNVGDVIQIPVGPFDLDTIQASASRIACSLFGTSSCITHRNGDCVEVLRY